MGRVDSKTKVYWSDKRRFADFCNGYIYDGNQVIKPEELSEIDPNFIHVDDANNRQLVADKAMKWKGRYIQIFVIENQNYIDYGMVLRNMLREAMAYDNQYNILKKKHKNERDLNGDEFLSGISKDDKFNPVITMVISFASSGWDGPKCLYDMLDVESDNNTKKFITNYRLNLFDYHDYDNFDMFKTEVKNLFGFLRYSEDKTALKKLAKEDQSYEEIEYETSKLIEELCNVKIIEEHENGGVGKVCKAFEDERAEGRAEGLAEGQAMIDKLKKELAAAKAEIENLKLSKSENS